MAGAGFKTFNTGDVLTASDVNTYLMQQTTMVFADASARSTALGANVAEGMISYLKDTNAVERYDGSSWGAIGAGDITEVTAGTGLTGGGTSGAVSLAFDVANYGGGQWAAGKNKIINGDFSIWQRGTSFTPSGSIFTADRWEIAYDGSGATRTISRQTFTPAAAPVSGYEGTYFYRYNQSVAGTGGTYNIFEQKIEDVRTFANQTVTVSFWAKADTTRNLTIQYSQVFGSGGSSAIYSQNLGASNTVSVTSSWQRFTVTGTIASISGKTIGTSSYLRLDFVLPNNTAFTFDVWGVQLEAGSVATPFQTATGTLQGELAACQRYFQILDSSESNFTPFMFGAGTTTTNIRFFANLPVSLRANGASVTVSAFGTWTTGNGNAAITAVAGAFIRNRNTLLIDMTTNSATVQRSAYSLEANNSASASIQISSEL